jgi:phosphoserine phosphatase
MIVFDFDKTLIDKDTLFGFYKAVHGDDLKFKIKRIILLVGAILYKLKIITNDSLKKLGIALFLNKKSQKDIEKVSENYVQKLKLNSIYHNIYLSFPKEKRIIISASPEIYLNKLFPEENILGTILEFKKTKVKLKLNCYSHNKLSRYNEIYSKYPIEAVYSDSYSDKPLFEQSKEVNIIKRGSIIANFINKQI